MGGRDMAGKQRRSNPVAVSDLISGVLDPVLQRRAGMTVGLVQSWEEIAGPRLARVSRPEKIAWPRRLREDDPFEPAVLIVACEGSMALHLQHETGEIIARVNAFLGFAAVARIRIVQKPVAPSTGALRPRRRALDPSEQRRIAGAVAAIDDEGLRESLARLGRSILAERKT